MKSTNLMELVAAVKAGKITAVKDQYGNIRGVGVNNPDLKVSEVGYVKQVGCGQVIGRTLEEMQADERAMREWTSKYNYSDVIDAINVGQVLAKPTWDENDVATLTRMLDSYVAANREVRTVERTVTVPAPAARGGLSDSDLANYLTVDELKAIRNRANREGDLTVKNAARRALRRKGVTNA